MIKKTAVCERYMKYARTFLFISTAILLSFSRYFQQYVTFNYWLCAWNDHTGHAVHENCVPGNRRSAFRDKLKQKYVYTEELRIVCTGYICRSSRIQIIPNTWINWWNRCYKYNQGNGFSPIIPSQIPYTISVIIKISNEIGQWNA